VKASVAQLTHSDGEVRLRAKLRLLRPEAAPLLKNHAVQIITALKDDWESEQSARILGLELPADLRNQLRDSPQIPDPVRGRLGDRASEQRVLARFKNAESVEACHKSAGDLTYLNSPAAWQTFAQGLTSTKILEDVHGNLVSVVLLLIQAYGNAHPEEPLFSSTEYLKHADLTPAPVLQAEHQAYLRQLESRLRVRQNIQMTLRPPFLLNTAKVEKHFQGKQ